MGLYVSGRSFLWDLTSEGGAFYRTLRQRAELFIGPYASGRSFSWDFMPVARAFCRTLRQWAELFIGLYVRFGCVA